MPVSSHSLLDDDTRARIARQLEDKGLLEWQIKTLLARPKFLRINPMTNYTPTRNLNAVVTANITARDQASMLTPANLPHVGSGDNYVHVVSFMVFGLLGDDDFELAHFAHVTVPAYADDDTVDIIRRACPLFDPASTAYWEYDNLSGDLGDELYSLVGLLPDTVPAQSYTSLATIPDPHKRYYVLVESDDE